MGDPVFVDTSALYALIVADDANHARALAEIDRLEAEGASLVTTSYVVLETVTLLLHRSGVPAVRSFRVGVEPALEVEWVGPEVHARAMSALLSGTSRRVSLTDFASFEVMRARRLRTAFAFDSDFRRHGFDLRG